MKTLLTETRESFERGRAQLAERPPSWCFGSRVESFRRLAKEGQLVWGYVVECDTALTKVGDTDGSALMVYGLDPAFDPLGTRLDAIAGSLNESRANKADRSMSEVHLMFEKRGTAPPRTRLPASIAREHKVELARFSLRKRELPGRVLTTPFVPLLVHEQVLGEALPLACWAPDLVAGWKQLVG
jgi:hypothetical protein